MKCKFCEVEHIGAYGKGIFCSRSCQSKYGVSCKTAESYMKFSRTIKERTRNKNKKNLTAYREKAIKAVNTLQNNLEYKYKNMGWESLPTTRKYKRVLDEQDNRCKECGINEWLGEKIILDLHHVDGNNQNNSRENLQYLCRNCHSQTANFRYRNW